jgi:hypothetical protein
MGWAMRTAIMVAAAALFAAQGTAAAQQVAVNRTGPCQKFVQTSNMAALDRDAMYLQAACVAARAGVAAPGNGPLSREELLSILMLMSLQQSAPNPTS